MPRLPGALRRIVSASLLLAPISMSDNTVSAKLDTVPTKRTSLYDTHLAAKAKMVPFAGYSMPVQYSGIRVEHEAVRKAAGLFDVSHMGNAWVTGPGAFDFLQSVSTADLAKIGDGGVQYSAMATHAGTAVDDILIYRLSVERFMIVLNASNAAKDLAWLRSHAPSSGIVIEDQGDSMAILALQGPKAEAILQPLTHFPLQKLPYYHCAEIQLLGQKTLISRTGYTGEDGFELFPAAVDAPQYWSALMEAGAAQGLIPVGLGARDTLRLEAGFSLYGHEITEQTDLLEAGLGWIVALDKPDFIGRTSLLKTKETGLKRRLVGLRMLEQGIPREGCAVAVGDAILGVVTSGTMSPTLNQGIALAYVAPSHAQIGSQVEVKIRDVGKKAEVVSRYFYRRKKES
jgi:aminomethyltransferase